MPAIESNIGADIFGSKYWLVHGAGPTNSKHMTKESAEREAARLAVLHPQQSFYVMEAVSVTKVAQPPVYRYSF